MKLNRIKIDAWMVHLAHLAAGIALSQAMSFARWSQWKPISSQINFHAALMAVLALGLFCAVLVIRSMTTRIEKLERVVASSTEPVVPIDAA